MTVFDLHADTATVMYDHRKLLTDPSLHLHADGLSRFASYTQKSHRLHILVTQSL